MLDDAAAALKNGPKVSELDQGQQSMALQHTCGRVNVQPTQTLTQTEYLARFEAVLQTMLVTTRAKNADYAQADDAFANFSHGPKIRPKMTLEDGIWFRMSDKWVRLCSLLDRPANVKDESLQDTLLDLANYAVILKIWLDFQGEADTHAK